MCGIAGIYRFDGTKVNEDTLKSMNNTLTHRGPDHGDVIVKKHIGLGHRRLSIIDLSAKANQPMESFNKRFTIVFNGEIYNFLEIKENLKKVNYKFKSNSDTELILAAFQTYGTECFAMFNGMFALAIYDKLEDTLILARDSFGIKPLYFYKNKCFICFASEIKAIKKHPEIDLTISNQAFSEYLWFGNPLGNNTIYKEIEELKAGSYKIISKSKTKEETYFSILNINQIDISEKKAIQTTRKLLEQSVKRHLISDVDVGVLLSGGIDSSAITAFASKHYKGKLKTYSIGFDFDKGINELPLAKSIADKFNTDHHEIKISSNDIIDVIENLTDSHDEPFADAANIPLYLVTKKLKGKVKVILQGDGGDEFFGGYSRYTTINYHKKWSFFSFLSKIIHFFNLKNSKIKRIQRFLTAISEKSLPIRNALLLTMESKYSNPNSYLSDNWKKKLNHFDPFIAYKKIYDLYPGNVDEKQALFYTDSQIILKDTFLEKVDKSTMANSIEVRVPFLDKELTEFALSLPAEMKVKKGIKKYLLKKSLENLIPDKILYGKKMGFGVPYGYWLNTGLKKYFLNQIGTDLAKKYFDHETILKNFKEHNLGFGNHDFMLWKVLIFSVWINKNKTYIND